MLMRMLNQMNNQACQIKSFLCVMILMAGLGFSGLAQAQVEVQLNVGGQYGDLNLADLAPNVLQSQDSKLSWDVGLDGLYRLPMHDKFAVGLRYRYAFLTEQDYNATPTPRSTSPEGETSEASQTPESDGGEQAAPDSDAQQAVTVDPAEGTLGKYGYNYHRIALLLNYRFLNEAEGLFAGLVVGVDLWKKLTLNVGATSTFPQLNNTRWIHQGLSGQLGVEAGYKVNQNFHVRAEIGYNYLPFNDWTLEDGETENAPGVTADDSKLDLSGFYLTLGVGWFFG